LDFTRQSALPSPARAALFPAIAGLGGGPFAGHKGAAGNVCTEALVFLCEQMDIATGIDVEKLIAAAQLAEDIVGHPLPSSVMRSGTLTKYRRQRESGRDGHHHALLLERGDLAFAQTGSGEDEPGARPHDVLAEFEHANVGEGEGRGAGFGHGGSTVVGDASLQDRLPRGSRSGYLT